MEYYKINFKTIYGDRIASSANGENVFNREQYFNRIRQREIIENAPIFDYFTLKSYDKKEFWEWALFDVFDGMGEYPGNGNWYISDDFKLLLENFMIAPKYHFYETRLLYKQKKIKYWIFQFPIDPLKNINFQKSQFILEGDDRVYNFSSEEEYLKFYRQEYRLTKRKLKTFFQVLKSPYDFFSSTNNDKVVSKSLKNAIERINLTGLEFSELDYEVLVDSSNSTQ